nr:hypothetical protein [Burkholderia sp. MS455]
MSHDTSSDGVRASAGGRSADAAVRHDWTHEQIAALFAAPLTDLLYDAQTIQRRCHAGRPLQISQLLSIKTGGCPEDCGYCSQSVHADTMLPASKLMDLDAVLAAAASAKAAGVQRFCMGAAWRSTSASWRWPCRIPISSSPSRAGRRRCCAAPT